MGAVVADRGAAHERRRPARLAVAGAERAQSGDEVARAEHPAVADRALGARAPALRDVLPGEVHDGVATAAPGGAASAGGPACARAPGCVATRGAARAPAPLGGRSRQLVRARSGSRESTRDLVAALAQRPRPARAEQAASLR